MSTPDTLRLGELDVSVFSDVPAAAQSILSIESGQAVVLTALNPEKFILAGRDESTRALLLRSTVLYPDGIGIVVALRMKHGESVTRIPGCELWERIIETCGKTEMPVFLIGATEAVVNEVAQKSRSEYGCNICGISDGYFSDPDELIAEIKSSGARFVSVAMGSPKQEHFMFACKDAGINAILMGVGGTYDVYVGAQQRAPKAMRTIGLEWLYRLGRQPSRLFRQRNLIVFAWRLISGKL